MYVNILSCFRYRVATGSEDQKIMIWDLRKRQSVYTIPSHTNLISHVKFHGKTNGSLFELLFISYLSPYGVIFVLKFCLSACMSIQLFICLSSCLSVCLPLPLSYPSVCHRIIRWLLSPDSQAFLSAVKVHRPIKGCATTNYFNGGFLFVW